ARRLAAQPRERLIAVKRAANRGLRAARAAVYQRELDMHAATFVGDARTLGLIESKFGANAPQVAAMAAAPVPASAPASAPIPAPAAATDIGAVVERLRQLLAQELFLQPQEIDDTTPFIDLGLDSITGVTFIRKINAHYGVEIEATKVYSLPTLRALAGHVAAIAGVGAAAAGSAPTVVPLASAVVSPAAPAAANSEGEGALLAQVIERLRDLLARELHLHAEEIGETTPFIDLGLDSITGVTWVRKINERYGIEIEATKVYSHPTLAGIGGYVLAEALRAGTLAAPVVSAAPVAAPAPDVAATSRTAAPAKPNALVSWRRAGDVVRAAAAPSRTNAPAANPMTRPIAVIGMAGQFPQARDLDQFWRNLAAGRDCIGEVGAQRWSLDAHYRPGAATPGYSYAKWLGALDDFDRFDPLFFNISPTEAESMDPQQRLFLQACWQSLENAGIDPQTLAGRDCGVFVGCGPSDYHQQSQAQRLSAQGFTGAATSILAARIAYFLNLRGPCLSVDTACSSSLVAIANACDSLNAGHSELALAGGVYVMGGPSMHIMTSQAGMLSADGRCYSFDQRANGFVPGEGVGVLLLKRLEDAQRDGDRIDAVIEGWGVNQDGRSNGITAPNEDAQTRLLQSVYRRFGIDPGGIGLIEAHGTGTKLGDPIEVAALKAAFAPFTQRAGYCALGSVKSNIGHCLTAAGAAGAIKLALALRHRQLPPSANFRQRNEHIRLDGSPFFVSERLREWDGAADAPRRGAVSSFGFSGTNAHLVLAEYVADAAAPARALDERGEYPLVLSARTEEQLRQRARDLLAFLRRSDAPEPDLLEIAYTLQTGREAMGERLGIMAGSVDALAAKLEAFLDGRDDVAGLFQAQVRRHREGLQLISQDADLRATLIGKWLEQGRLSKLLELWCKGLELDWTALYGAQRPRRIALPDYPFARQRYWLEPEAAGAPPAVAAVAAPAAAAVAPTVAAPPAAHPARDSLSYVRQWEELPAAPAVPAAAAANVLIVLSDACHGLERDLIAHHRRNGAGRVRLLSFGADTAQLDADHWQCGLDDAQAFADALAELPRVDALYFLAASERAAHSDDDAETCQRRNERALLRLGQALRRQAKLGDSLDAFVITLDNHPPHGGAGRSWGAGASGLAHALAQGQHRWRVRNLDLSSDDLAGPPAAREAALAAILTEPASDRGELIRLQAGKRYRQGFLRLDWGDAAPAGDARAAFKHGGVYLIVGGSGIVGRIVTRELIGRYRAQVVWIGRSPADAPRIRAAFDQFGAALSYVQADALDEAALRAALARIQRECGRIDGAVFSGMEFGADDAAEAIDEEAFARIVAVKTQGVRAFHRAVRGEALDFVCYFSSGQAYAFSGAARLSAYASGIGHADAFVRAVRGECGFPVGILNWGFWQAAVDERIGKLERVSTRSLDALGDAEGFDCFERFVAELQRGRIDQALCMRASPEVEALMRCDSGQYLRLDAPQAAREVALDEAALAIDADAIAATVAAHAERGLEPWFARLLRAQLERMAGPGLAESAHSAEQLQRRCAIQDKYLPWLRASLELLAAHDLAELDADGALLPSAPLDADALWSQWRERLPGYLADPQSRALAELSDECLRRLPEILRGGVAATDVLFPNGSMDKVAGLYRDNATADTFNDLVAEAVAAYVRRRRERDPAFRLRLLEIGAGTGGTSKRVFERLRPLREAVERYCYTDLSKAFFLHAQRNYLPEHPYIVCQRLDIEQPVEAQGIAACDYDLVIATNALHATGDIRRTLRHAKTALRAGGRLIVSEMSDKSLSTHLSFGLLDGWWLFRDAELRVPGCPGLAPATWQRVLEQEGFDQIALPAPQAQALGNQVVIARSNGAVRRAWSAAEASARPAVAAVAAPARA
ncbi:beta-ketoacyl synthase N-terminal-like domain-containing protein, partial [Lysobacter enzymogenes]|uniref:beta-ketoacyl synthase N-terminal-like domain-containing protein n=1 Tax=Lysobacter enzymogenes TaxID=69 RepID=UPI0019D133CB